MDSLSFSNELEVPLKFLTSLGIGLLLGLQRQRTPGAKAGLRTFALVALVGTMSGLIADAASGSWIVGIGMVLVGLTIVSAYRNENESQESDMGTTTIIAALLCYGLGVMTWYGQSQLAAAIGITATALLQFKTELHGISERLSRQDVTSVLQFGVLTFIILPLLPDQGYGPYDALNPYHVWLMVVLVSGVSLVGYLTLRLVAARQSVLLAGVAGGLVSSTATTLVYARQARLQPDLRDVSGAVIVISNLMVLVRIIVIATVVAPAAILTALPLFGSALLLGLVPLLYLFRPTAIHPGFKVPELSNPTQLHVALSFGGLYALVLVASAWLSGHVGSEGFYGLALMSGLVDIDAITLSGLGLYNSGRIGVTVAVTAIALAYLAAVAFKLLIVLVAGDARILKRWGLALLTPAVAIAAGLVLFG